MAARIRAWGDRPRNSFRCLRFTTESFKQEVRDLSRGSRTSHRIEQVEYLANYLDGLGASSLLVESHYIDRHFIEEVGLYYSRCLLSKSNSCARIHVFRALGKKSLHGTGMLDSILRRATNGSWREVNEELRAAYLGFISVRPLPSVPVGRTILIPPQGTDNGASFITTSYTVHVLGFEIPLQGLAFQQQDRAVGACATTAIWTALQRSCKHEGGRPPTPSAISEAASRYSLPLGRPLPSPGLTIEQICEALRHFEFPPEVLDPRENLAYFKLRVQIYLRSGIPVILAVKTGDGGHAVTLVGYKSEVPRKSFATLLESEPGPAGQDPLETVRKLRLLNLDLDHVYLHDDRLGPYALARLAEEEETAKDPEGPQDSEPCPDEPEPRLRLKLKWPDGGCEDVEVSLAIVPLYPKLRSAAGELFETALDLFPLIRECFAGPGDELAVDIFFERSGRYLSDLYRLSVSPDRLPGFLRKIALSRYVGVIRWHLNGEAILDTVWDTTDQLRETRNEEHLLGILSFRPSDYPTVDEIGELLGSVVG